MIRFIEVLNETNFNSRLERTSTPRFTLGEVWINSQYVVSVQEAKGYKSLLAEGHLPPDLDPSHGFTVIKINRAGRHEQHVVVGSPGVVAERLGSPRHQLLKG